MKKYRLTIDFTAESLSAAHIFSDAIENVVPMFAKLAGNIKLGDGQIEMLEDEASMTDVLKEFLRKHKEDGQPEHSEFSDKPESADVDEPAAKIYHSLEDVLKEVFGFDQAGTGKAFVGVDIGGHDKTVSRAVDIDAAKLDYQRDAAQRVRSAIEQLESFRANLLKES